jgi:hypothetical protein
MEVCKGIVILKREINSKLKKSALSGLLFYVENIGFEPITSSLPAKRSSQMS